MGGSPVGPVPPLCAVPPGCRSVSGQVGEVVPVSRSRTSWAG